MNKYRFVIAGNEATCSEELKRAGSVQKKSVPYSGDALFFILIGFMINNR